MSRFYVGQRVRIKWSEGWPELGGQGGIIHAKAIGNMPGTSTFGKGVWIIRPDSWDSIVAPRIGNLGAVRLGALEDQLELLTDSYDVTSWDTCVWKPEHLRVGV